MMKNLARKEETQSIVTPLSEEEINQLTREILQGLKEDEKLSQDELQKKYNVSDNDWD